MRLAMAAKMSSMLSLQSASNSRFRKVVVEEEELEIKKKKLLSISTKRQFVIWGNGTHVEIRAAHKKRTALKYTNRSM